MSAATNKSESRYSRQELVPGWEQATLSRARVLVVGAGALGNEVLKNLVLSGVGHVDIADFDIVEISNLSRCVLFSESDLGRNKAVAAAERLQAMNPEVQTRALAVDVEHELGAASLRVYDLVLGCVDTIAARLAVNRLCRQAGVRLLDGGMDAFGGQVSLFDPQVGACYECGMNARMWARVNERQGCLRRGSGEDIAERKLASTVTTAAMIGSLQAAQAVQLLLGQGVEGPQPLMPGQRLCFRSAPYESFILDAAERGDCASHALSAARKITLDCCTETTAREVLQQASAQSLQLGWDVVTALECFGCSREPVILPAFRLDARTLRCAVCGKVRVPEMQSSIGIDEDLAGCTLNELGVPERAMLEVATGDETLMVELCGPLAGTQTDEKRMEVQA